jgi:serine/threonine-protein kinase
MLDVRLALDGRFSPRRTTFHAQLRAEGFLAAGDIERALEALRAADKSGLIDILWLEHCPVLEAVRNTADYASLQTNTAARVERVVAILEPDAQPYR